MIQINIIKKLTLHSLTKYSEIFSPHLIESSLDKVLSHGAEDLIADVNNLFVSTMLFLWKLMAETILKRKFLKSSYQIYINRKMEISKICQILY